ncbi:MAG: methyltransferase domain-containing protein [Gallionella sp.]
MESNKILFDENIVCPATGETLTLSQDGLLVSTSGRQYPIIDEIPLLFVEEDGSTPAATTKLLGADGKVTHAVQDFYEEAPFPNYNSFDDIASFVKRADAGIFARLLRQQIPINSNVLEVGCGTAQLSNYLAATTPTRVYAADMTLASLRLGHDFAKRNGIEGVRFIQTNLFVPPVKPQSMDIVISNGVLHHTYDTKKAFMSISRLVKPGGYIIIGLYNHIGRLRTDIRRVLVKMFGERVLFLDPHLRNNLSPEKRRAWINDQYYHPQEREHSISELMQWFDEAGFSFVSSIPKIIGDFSNDEPLFEPQNPGTPSDRIAAEIGMLFSSLGGEGGLYICIGRRKFT